MCKLKVSDNRPNSLRLVTAHGVCWLMSFIALLTPALLGVLTMLCNYEWERGLFERAYVQSNKLVVAIGNNGPAMCGELARLK